VLLFGPGDFSHLIGKAGQITDPEVVAARKRVAAAAKKNGKYMMAPGMMAPRAVLEAEGYTIFTLGADVLGLADYLQAKLKSFQDGSAAEGSRIV
jgi:4-hydroxy-2-oxoheptanedioate aldolase